MITAILNLLLVAAGLTVTAVWIISLANHDGKCHYDDCGECPYEGTCPMEEEHEAEHESDT
ncbi:MAG: hypothetical protein IJ820_02470 [Lachnospiraceae bacterium]|nr:hypothetical protein [Lachnospiraceae bacterium]